MNKFKPENKAVYNRGTSAVAVNLSEKVEVRINHVYPEDNQEALYSVSWPPTGYAMLRESSLCALE